ncbi:MAG: DMT family transporter, partial [Sphingomonadales bacterium]|nr:DMT family transporter [Sphingomonadales bacterium]
MSNTALFILISLIWGSTFYAITFQLGDVAKEWSLFYRFLISTVLLFAFSHLTKRQLKFKLKDHRIFLGLGVLLFGVNYYLTYAGTERLPSGLVAIVFSTITLMNILNSAWLLKRPFEHSILWAAVVGVVG